MKLQMVEVVNIARCVGRSGYLVGGGRQLAVFLRPAPLFTYYKNSNGNT